MKKMLPVLALLSACGTVAPPAVWHSTPPLVATREKVLHEMAGMMAKNDFVIETRDDAGGLMTSKWMVMLRPQWREGKRYRCEMRLLMSGSAYVVQIMITREANDNAKKPLSGSDADWIDDGGDEERAWGMAKRIYWKVMGTGSDQ